MVKYKEFKIRELFDIHPTKSYGLTNDKLFSTKGLTPVVVNSSLNNGIGGYIDLKPTENGNTITFSDTTTDSAIFYQPDNFIGYSHVQGLYPLVKNVWNQKSLLYFLTLFKKSAKGRFDYATKFNRTLALDMVVKLPINNNTINFQYMEKYISELEEERISELEEERISELNAYLKVSGLENYELTNDEKELLNKRVNYKEFKIDDLFNIFTGRDVIINTLENGNIPLISHQHNNNGITKYIKQLNNRNLFNYKDTIALADRGVFYATTQKTNFHIGTRVKALTFKNGEQNEKIRLFFVASINKLQILFKDYLTNATDKLPNLLIKLPINSNNEIDYEYMEKYITAQQKLVIKNLIQWRDKQINATKQVI